MRCGRVRCGYRGLREDCENRVFPEDSWYILSRPGDVLFEKDLMTTLSSSGVNGLVSILSSSEILILGSGWSFNFGRLPSRDLKCNSQLDLRFAADPPFIRMEGFSFRPASSFMTFHEAACYLKV